MPACWSTCKTAVAAAATPAGDTEICYTVQHLVAYLATIMRREPGEHKPVVKEVTALLGRFWEASFEHHCWLPAAASNVGLPACRLQLLLQQLKIKADCRPTQAYQATHGKIWIRWPKVPC